MSFNKSISNKCLKTKIESKFDYFTVFFLFVADSYNGLEFKPGV